MRKFNTDLPFWYIDSSKTALTTNNTHTLEKTLRHKSDMVNLNGV